MSHRNLGIKGMAREVAEAQEWVSTVMETPWEGTFEEYLKDGQVRRTLLERPPTTGANTRTRRHPAPDWFGMSPCGPSGSWGASVGVPRLAQPRGSQLGE